MPKTFRMRPRPEPSPFLAPANAGPAARRKGSVVSGHDGQSEVPTLVMRDAAQGLKREAVRLMRQDSGLPDALKKLRASRQLEMALATPAVYRRRCHGASACLSAPASQHPGTGLLLAVGSRSAL